MFFDNLAFMYRCIKPFAILFLLFCSGCSSRAEWLEEVTRTHQIRYTATERLTINKEAFSANITTHKFNNGEGVINFEDIVTSIGDWAFAYRENLTSIIIPECVTEIGGQAFFYCSSLASITIPDSVTSIGYSAFDGCSSLASVTIGKGVTSIGHSAFDGCSSLTDVYISDIAAWCGISFGSFDANPLHRACNLYLNGKLVTDLIIPEGVESIEHLAFYGCSSLASITFPESVTSIGQGVFSNCSSLASITIPDGVTSIGDSAFYDCSSLTSITIPDSVTSIGGQAFYYCSSLAEVYCKATTPPTAIPNSSSKWRAFDSNASGRKIYVPEESVEAYKTAEWWSEYADAIVGYRF